MDSLEPINKKAPDEKFCSECRAVIKANAVMCPYCGSLFTAKKKTNILRAVGIGIVTFIVIMIIMIVIVLNSDTEFDDSADTTPSKPAVKSLAERRREMIESQFSGWDGTHMGLKQYVKDRMNDPSSFKHVETTYVDKGTYLIVTMRFRGKNAFGGLVLNRVIAKTDLRGHVLEIIYSGQ